MNDDAKAQIKRTWDAAAEGYAAWDQMLGEELVPATQTLFDLAGVAPGMRVLDLACGSGRQSLLLAERVGPEGTVVANDISQTMLGYARDRLTQAGFANVETLHGAAEDLTGLDESFDACICRLGLMLFPDPEAALKAVRQTLKPGARFAALVFSTPKANPFMAETLDILLRRAGREAPKAGEPGIFALGEPGALEALLAKAGFGQIESTTVQARLQLASAEDALAMMRQAFGVYHAVVADLDEAARQAAWDEVSAHLRQWEGAEGFVVGREFAIAGGAKP